MNRESHSIHPFDLATAVTDQVVELAGSLLCFWHSGDASDVIQVRFDHSDAPATPMMRGDRIERTFSRIYLTTPGTGTGIGYFLYGDKDKISVRKGADVTGSMADVVAELQDIEAAVDAALTGGTEVLTPAAAATAQGADQVCRMATFWTPDGDIHFNIAAAASAATPLLPANSAMTLSILNTDVLRFFNNGAGAETVNIVRIT